MRISLRMPAPSGLAPKLGKAVGGTPVLGPAFDGWHGVVIGALPLCASLPSRMRCSVSNKVRTLEPRRTAAPLDTPTDLSKEAVRDLSAALTALLADTSAVYVKNKNSHGHGNGPHFRDYHLLLDDQAAEIEKSIDILAERV